MVIMLRLEAPLQSFGGTKIDERYPTLRHPALSAVTGLIGNAAGYRRTYGESLQRLQESIRIGSRIDAGGVWTLDYQTAGGAGNPVVNQASTAWSRHGIERRDGDKSKVDITIQTWREYWADSSVLVAVEAELETARWIADALRKPARPLFIGRKACLPCSELLEGVSETGDLFSALSTWPTSSFSEAGDRLDVQVPDETPGTENWKLEKVHDVKDWQNGVVRGYRLVRRGRVRRPQETEAA